MADNTTVPNFCSIEKGSRTKEEIKKIRTAGRPEAMERKVTPPPQKKKATFQKRGLEASATMYH